jgi:hypothetical protein
MGSWRRKEETGTTTGTNSYSRSGRELCPFLHSGCDIPISVSTATSSLSTTSGAIRVATTRPYPPMIPEPMTATLLLLHCAGTRATASTSPPPAAPSSRLEEFPLVCEDAGKRQDENVRPVRMRLADERD